MERRKLLLPLAALVSLPFAKRALAQASYTPDSRPLIGSFVKKFGDTMRGALNWANAVTLPSASTVNIGAAASNYVVISGTTTITAFDTIAQGAMRWVRFSGALTLTYNATSLILPSSANITTAAGDEAVIVSEGSGNWRCLSYNKADGTPLVAGASGALTLISTQTANNTSTSLSWTGLGSTYTNYLLVLTNLDTGSTNQYRVQFGTGATPTWLTSNYTSNTTVNAAGTVTGTYHTSWGNILLDVNNIEAPMSASMIISSVPSGVSSVQGTLASVSGSYDTVQFGGYNSSATAKTAIRILTDANIVSGTASLYGISS